jgi:peptidoglycan L-alanyl-D-glutamate endopeptidase CwlK
MKDLITLERIKLLHPKLIKEANDIYNDISIQLKDKSVCRFTSTFRTFEEQDEIYAQGRTKAGSIVSHSKGGLSYHNYGLAIDIVLLINGKATWDTKTDFDKDGIADWMEVVAIFKSYGWEAGIDWKFRDAPHFQKTFGYSVRQLLELYRNKKYYTNKYVII